MGLPFDERQLVQQLVARQPAAWSRFVSRYQGLIANCVRHTARQCQFELNAVEIEDVCAEVFASLIVNDFRSLRQFRGQCRISTWLVVIARRVCLGQLSRMRRVHHSTQRNDATMVTQQHDLLSQLIREEQHENIRTSVQQLNKNDQLLLELYFRQQLSYAEIGEQAGISPNSVGPKLGRAIVRLRKLVRRV